MFKKIIACAVLISSIALSACSTNTVAPVVSASMLAANTVSLKRQLDAIDLPRFKNSVSEDNYRVIEQVYADSKAIYVELDRIGQITSNPEVALTGVSQLFEVIDKLRQSYSRAYAHLAPQINNVEPSLAETIRQFDSTAQALERQYQALMELDSVQDYGPILESALLTVRLGLTVVGAVI